MTRLATMNKRLSDALTILPADRHNDVLRAEYHEGGGVQMSGKPLDGEVAWAAHSFSDKLMGWIAYRGGVKFFGLADMDQAAEWGCDADLLADVAAVHS